MSEDKPVVWAYMLDKDKNPIRVNMFAVDQPEFLELLEQRSHHELYVVGQTEIGEHRISTVFLGVAHYDFAREGQPVLFETMLFPETRTLARYCTWDEALAGHEAIVAKLKAEHKFVAKLKAEHERS